MARRQPLAPVAIAQADKERCGRSVPWQRAAKREPRAHGPLLGPRDDGALLCTAEPPTLQLQHQPVAPLDQVSSIRPLHLDGPQGAVGHQDQDGPIARAGRIRPAGGQRGEDLAGLKWLSPVPARVGPGQPAHPGPRRDGQVAAVHRPAVEGAHGRQAQVGRLGAVLALLQPLAEPQDRLPAHSAGVAAVDQPFGKDLHPGAVRDKCLACRAAGATGVEPGIDEGGAAGQGGGVFGGAELVAHGFGFKFL
jgi:hypothetical protein